MERDGASLLETIRRTCSASWRVMSEADPVRLVRVGSATPSRTLMICSLNRASGPAEALKAAAKARVDLAEPAASGLYLFLIADESVTPDEASALENDERFCRKYVWGFNETVDEFLERTFLGLHSLPEGVSGAEEVGPRSRILKRIGDKGGSPKRAAVLLDAIAALPDGLVDPTAWLHDRLTNSGEL